MKDILEKSVVIYCYTNNINGKKYIGQTRNKLRERHKGHIKYSKNISNNSVFCRAIRKYGMENFTLSVLHEYDDPSELNYYEQLYIGKHDTMNSGYNMTNGGDNYSCISDELREKYRVISARRYRSGTHVFCNTDFNGENNPFYGRRHTDKAKKMIGDANRGENSHNFGKGRSVICLNNKEVYRSLRHAFDNTGASKSGITGCCRGERKYAGRDEFGNKLLWMYYDEYINMTIMSEVTESQ